MIEQPTKSGELLSFLKRVIFCLRQNSLHCTSKCKDSSLFLTALPSIAAVLVPTNVPLSLTWRNACKRTILCLRQPRATGSKGWQRNIKCERTLKHLKIGPYGIMAIVLIALAISVRILLAALGWPRTNSDEGTMGLMALHIAYRGEHPIFYYGQNYMGALEAYLGAALFRIFGVSVFTLRLGLIFLFALFLLSTYLLASLLYTKKLALVTLALLSLGSITLLIRELTAIGGYLETLLFGSLSFLFASWLALTSPSSTDSIWPRFIGYGAWGLVIGLGFWSDFLILPFVLMPGLLLLVFCWRELIKWAGLFLLTGLVIGAFPLIFYNLHAQPGQDSLSILWRLQHNAGIAWANPTQISLLHQLQGTIQISLPTITGNPFCPITELSFLGP